jgi:hypothetical protein
VKRKSRATIRIVAGALCVSYILSTLPTPLYVSTYLIACYCGTSIPVIGVGLVAAATNRYWRIRFLRDSSLSDDNRRSARGMENLAGLNNR